MLVTRMLVTANNQLASNQHAMEWDPHTHVGYSSSHVGYSHVGYSHVGYSHVGYLPHVGYMDQKYEITNVRSPAGWLLLHNSVITNMRATKLQGAGWLSRMLAISCWFLHLARLVCNSKPNLTLTQSKRTRGHCAGCSLGKPYDMAPPTRLHDPAMR